MRILLIFAVIALSSAYPFKDDFYSEEWIEFKLVHDKSYNNLFEDEFRMKVFMDNKKKIDAHNAKYEQGIVSFKMKMNHFGDLMSHEFAALMNGLNKTLVRNLKKVPDINYGESVNVDEPLSIDWREKGAVTPVKNQGDCGSCWSFSATGSLEGQIFRKTGKLISLSEQNLIDCSTNYGNSGCSGGLMDHAFQYIKDNHGIDTEASYPYEAQDNNCRFKPNKIGGSDKGYADLPTNEDALKKAIATFGPISVAIDASHESFQFYASGIYDEPRCSSTDLDHGVLAVGYGSEDSTDFWLVKNSWGESWGENGYIRMIRNKNNQCGIATMASYPIV